MMQGEKEDFCSTRVTDESLSLAKSFKLSLDISPLILFHSAFVMHT